jgi:GAF domain-containing protein
LKQDRVITRSTTVRKRKDIEPKKARKSLSQTEQALRQRADELAALHALSVDIAAAMDFPTLLEKIVQRAAELLNATGGAIALCDEAKKEVLLAVEHSPASNIHPGVVFKYGEGATGRVAKTGKPLIIDDYRTWSGRAKVYEQSKPYTAVLSVPMIWQGKVVGVLQVMADTDKRRFTKADQELLSLFATQAAIAIENTRLYSQTATEQRHLSLLFELARELTASLEPVEILNRAISLTCHSLEGLIGQAFLYQGDTEKLVLQAIYGRPEDWLDEPTHRIVLKPGQGLGGWVAKNRQPVYIPDVANDKRWLFISGVDEDVHSAISAPILSGDRLLGVLSVMHVQTGAFSTGHLTLLQAICQEVGLALANAERYQQVQRQLAEITFIQNLAQTFNRRLQLQELLNEVVTQLAERLGYPLVEIFLIDRDSLLQRAAYGVTATSDRLLMSQGIIGRVARTGQVALVPDVSQDPDYLPSYASTVAELVVPIIHGSVVVGIINIETGTPGQLTTRDRELLEVLAGQISIALENAVLYEHLRTHIGDL